MLTRAEAGIGEVVSTNQRLQDDSNRWARVGTLSIHYTLGSVDSFCGVLIYGGKAPNVRKTVDFDTI